MAYTALGIALLNKKTERAESTDLSNAGLGGFLGQDDQGE